MFVQIVAGTIWRALPEAGITNTRWERLQPAIAARELCLLVRGVPRERCERELSEENSILGIAGMLMNPKTLNVTSYASKSSKSPVYSHSDNIHMCLRDFRGTRKKNAKPHVRNHISIDGGSYSTQKLVSLSLVSVRSQAYSKLAVLYTLTSTTTTPRSTYTHARIMVTPRGQHGHAHLCR